MKAIGVVTAVLLLALGGCATDARQPPSVAMGSADRGGQIAREKCGGCHAVAAAGDSPMAVAPPFRDMGVAYPISDLQEAMAEGLVTAHPAMPAFTFEPDQIADLIAYMELVSGTGER